MKRLILLIVSVMLLLPLNSQSRLKDGQWVKIAVNESGIYCLTYNQLRKWGLNPAATHVYGYGGAMLNQNLNQPAIDDLPLVGCLRLNDCILFYGQGSFSWSYKGLHFEHERNPYSDKGYYFLSDKPTSEPDIETAEPIVANNATEVKTFMDLQVHDKDIINLVDVGGVEGGGRVWYGEQLVNNKAQSFNFPFTDIMGSEIYVSTMVAGISSAIGTTRIALGDNSFTLTTQPTGDMYEKATTAKLGKNLAPIGSGKQTINVTYSSSVTTAVGYLNYIEVQAECALAMQGNAFCFRSPTNYTESQLNQYHLSKAPNGTIILDITYLDNIRLIPTQTLGNELVFVGSNEDKVHEYVAINPNGQDWLEVEYIGKVDNQNLHNLQGIQYVIITPKEFIEPSEQLARAHEGDPYWKGDPITWAVVTDEQVYNEFSSGTPDATAYRRFMKMLYDRAKADSSILSPRWLLLMGDGTFDNRKLLNQSGPNKLLTYQTINSTTETLAESNDGYFGCLDNVTYSNDASVKMQIGVGRLPVSTKEEAQAMVDKIERYIYDDTPNGWRRELLFMADNYDTYAHIECADKPAVIIENMSPSYLVHKIYLDIYPKQVSSTSERCPVAKTQFDNLLQSGVAMLNYSGHGGYNAITSEAMMDINSIKTMTNPNLALWFFATCSFAHFDSGKRCAAEEAVLNKNGGAIAVISACRTVYASWNMELNKTFCEELFAHEDDYHYDVTIGEALAWAKNQHIGNTNKLAYHLLGDPALRLHYPDDVTVHTTAKQDTTRALDVNTIQGVIADGENDTLSSFNGIVDIVVYDKPQTITAKVGNGTYTFRDYPNILFRGTAEAKDGCFEYTFMTPKDIRYNYDKGRIVYFAYDEENDKEGIGYDNSLTIGGTNTIEIVDNEGPTIDMYLENTFRDSTQSTYAEPRFYASLYDEHGINTVGSGIGHDLYLIVDDETTMAYNLNSYFAADQGSYQSGKISYRLPPLEDGPHSLRFKAWDLMNNSSAQTLNFSVSATTSPTLYRIIAYPNPARLSETLTLHLEHDQEDEVLQTEISIYDFAGRRLYLSHQTDAYDVQIPMSQVAISTGVYIYKVIIKSPTNGSSTLSGKILVVP